MNFEHRRIRSLATLSWSWVCAERKNERTKEGKKEEEKKKKNKRGRGLDIVHILLGELSSLENSCGYLTCGNFEKYEHSEIQLSILKFEIGVGIGIPHAQTRRTLMCSFSLYSGAVGVGQSQSQTSLFPVRGLRFHRPHTPP